MSTNWITIIGMVGASAQNVQARIEKQAKDDKLDDLVGSLLLSAEKHASQPPVQYYQRYIDHWSLRIALRVVGLGEESDVPLDKGYFIHYLGGTDIILITPPFLHELKISLENKLPQWDFNNDHIEIDMLRFIRSVLEGIHCIKHWPYPLLIIVFQFVGGSIGGEEVEASLEEIPDWILKLGD